ncbi:MAG: bacillithiol system redox-active protein YtxJ [Cyclobacteriaceae bacterium]|nr:bacillithiol system redox-active protein YtxJ [Cyclobacteriaceae bacterium]
MAWKLYCREEDVKSILALSKNQYVLVFKHSTRCPVSSYAKHELDQNLELLPPDMEKVYIDVVNCRALSGAIEKALSVRHESPQVLLIYNESCIYADSHYNIKMQNILKMIPA